MGQKKTKEALKCYCQLPTPTYISLQYQHLHSFYKQFPKALSIFPVRFSCTCAVQEYYVYSPQGQIFWNSCCQTDATTTNWPLHRATPLSPTTKKLEIGCVICAIHSGIKPVVNTAKPHKSFTK